MKKIILTILFIFSLITISYAEECPYGDAVVVSKKDINDTNIVECVNWNIKKQKWETWFRNSKNKRIYQYWEPELYDIHTMDGKLEIKKDKVIIIPTGKEISVKEAQELLANVIKEN